MNISKVEDFIAYNMAKDLMNTAAGNGIEFEIMYQALINSMQKNGEISGENGLGLNANLSDFELDNMPLLIRGQNNGQMYGKEPISYSINNSISSLIKENFMNASNIKGIYSGNASNETMEKIMTAVDKYSAKYGVDRNLILAIIKQESNFNPNAESPAGAKGLMQLMDFNTEAYGITNPFSIEENIEGGVRHIKSYLDSYNGNKEMALMAYNGGPGTMQRRGVNLPEDLYKMPEETQNYVPKVLNYYKNGI